ncbi:MAG: 50S ribosomal protein L1, partial [Pseudomonadota bacterium]|nr:50S ribosomal protein L1 [Pseudomonadota bacterium]
GAIEYRAEKAGIIHAGVGKLSFDDKKLTENVTALVKEVARVKPSGAKGNYMKKITLSSTMGPGLKLDIQSFFVEAKKAA